MGDRNTEISAKVSFVPGFGPPDQFSGSEETTYAAQGLEISASYNVLGKAIGDDTFFLGPRLDLSATGVRAARYRSQVRLPVNDLNGLDERFNNPEYRATEIVDSVHFVTGRAGVSVGIGPEADLGMPTGFRLFMTAGPEMSDADYTIQYLEPGRRDQRQDGVTALSLKGGVELLVMMEIPPGMGVFHEPTDFGLILGIAALRTFNPITRESEAAPAFDAGLMVRF
ncbi:MAG: hypothetical protein HY542_07645 [Deltaproteobacteria bacterium]|nr:hypothetical protein [Deltaproteobacteria bacterium]